MKNMTRWIAMLLTCLLVLGLGMTAASADTCYEVIKLVYEDQEDDTFVYLGKGQNFSSDVDPDTVYFIVNVVNGYVGVTGRNISGNPEGYCWLDVSDGDALLAFVEFCIGYETFSECVDECDALVGGIYLTEDGDPIIVSDAASAENFVEAVSEWLEQQ